MRSAKQQAASRANGAKSRGPRTPQGKRNSSKNSIRHGLLARNVLLQGESKARFLGLVKSLFAEHHPQTPTEVLLVQTLATTRWRLDRIQQAVPCFDRHTLWDARTHLVELDLIAYRPWRSDDPDGCYQVLSLQRPPLQTLSPELKAAVTKVLRRLEVPAVQP